MLNERQMSNVVRVTVTVPGEGVIATWITNEDGEHTPICKDCSGKIGIPERTWPRCLSCYNAWIQAKLDEGERL